MQMLYIHQFKSEHKDFQDAIKYLVSPIPPNPVPPGTTEFYIAPKKFTAKMKALYGRKE